MNQNNGKLFLTKEDGVDRNIIGYRVVVGILLLFFLGCQSTYYMVWEKLGREKRHLLKSNVESVQEEQQEASEQFQSVVDHIKEMYGFDGGSLEDFYENLSDDYLECEERAENVRDRVAKVERIATDLFNEWENEIGEISNTKLKADSQKKLDATRKRYDRLHVAMVKAKESMEPVLNNLKDYVLYLKHNLNAQAISSLKKEVDDIEVEVNSLIEDMNKSIHEAKLFAEEIAT
jgi:hypothetical protein